MWCCQTRHNRYLPVVYGTTLNDFKWEMIVRFVDFDELLTITVLNVRAGRQSFSGTYSLFVFSL
jgi:hypothetical protein